MRGRRQGDARHGMEILSASLTSRLKASSKTINRGWLQLSAGFRGNGSSTSDTGCGPPLRTQLFSAHQMKLHSRILAASHKLSPERPRDRLLAPLGENTNRPIGVPSP